MRNSKKKTLWSIAIVGVVFLFAHGGISQDYLLVCNQENFFKPENAELEKKIARGDSLIAVNKQKEAISIFKSIVKEKPDHLRSWQRLAQLYSWNEMPEKAIKAYEQIVRLNPMDNEAKKKLAQFYLWNDRQKESIELYEKILIFEPKNLEIHKKLADLYSWDQMPDKAIAEYEEIVRLDSMNTKIMKMLADHYFWKGQADDGIRMLERVVSLEPDTLELRKKLAQHYVWNNQPEKAIDQYKAILEKNPDDRNVLKKLAQQYMWNNNPGQAALFYEKLISLEPDSINHKIQLTHAYLWSNQSAKAEKPLHEILQRQPFNKDALMSLAEIERWSGRWDLAKSRLEKVKISDTKNKRVLELLRDIRNNYGSFISAKYTRLSDSNLITRESMPLGATCFHNRKWDFQYQTAQYRVTDDRLDSTLVGYGARAEANYHPFVSTTISIELGAVNYSSNWTPFSAKVQLLQSIKGKFTGKLAFEQHETEEGVRALRDRIILRGFSSEAYWQIFPRLAISGNYQQFRYSDDNKKITATAASWLTIKMQKPNLYMYGYYLYEDFDKIYPTSLPYWTPERLKTSSFGFNAKQPISRLVSLEAGYALTRQQGINSNNVNSGVEISFTGFDKFSFRYQKSGSEVYHYTNLVAYFEYRF